MIGGRPQSRRGFFGILAGTVAAPMLGLPAPTSAAPLNTIAPECLGVWTEVVGGDQYLRMDFDFGPGAVAIEQVWIGDKAIADLSDAELHIWHAGCDHPRTTAQLAVRATDQLNGVPVVSFDIRDAADPITCDLQQHAAGNSAGAA
jgi:hypothetical protein